MTEPKIRFKRDDGSSFPDWEEITFDSLYEPLNNNTYSRDCLNYENGEAKNIHYGDILVKFGEICDVQKEELPFVNDGNLVQKYASLQDGDIILADTAEDETVGKAIEMHNVNGENVISGLHTMVCRPRLPFAPKYLGYYMNSSSYHSQLKPYMQGIKVTSIGRKNIAETMISYPSDEKEQQKIADFLSNVDEVIAASEEEVANLEQQKKAVMQKIFSQEVRFKREDGSDFPDWEEKKLGDICSKIGSGKTPKGGKETYTDFGVALIRSQNVLWGRLDLTDVAYIAETINNTMKNSEVKYGDILLNITGASIGRVCVFMEDIKANINQHVCIIRIENKSIYNQKFILQLLMSEFLQSQIWLLQNGGSREGLNFQQISNFDILLPCCEEQQKIADFLTSYDEAITAAKQELAKWKELKKGLLQQMFV